MTIREEQIMGCPSCGHKQKVGFYQAINVKLNPELKERLFRGELNLYKCEKCGNRAVVDLVFLYHDADKHFCVQYCPFDLVAQRSDKLSNMYTVEGKLNIPANIRLPETAHYMYEPHIVLSLDEMIRYVQFREALYEKHADKKKWH
ncbi:MAG: hypothetical protein JW927_18000 [Deltaproteobacteria bacterium]|nr:hypothetical protein [Deltaproteobacteria bacterium]